MAAALAPFIAVFGIIYGAVELVQFILAAIPWMEIIRWVALIVLWVSGAFFIADVLFIREFKDPTPTTAPATAPASAPRTQFRYHWPSDTHRAIAQQYGYFTWEDYVEDHPQDADQPARIEAAWKARFG